MILLWNMDSGFITWRKYKT